MHHFDVFFKSHVYDFLSCIFDFLTHNYDSLSHHWAFYLVIMTYICVRGPAVFACVVRILLCRMLSHFSSSVCVSTYHRLFYYCVSTGATAGAVDIWTRELAPVGPM